MPKKKTSSRSKKNKVQTFIINYFKEEESPTRSGLETVLESITTEKNAARHGKLFNFYLNLVNCKIIAYSK